MVQEKENLQRSSEMNPHHKVYLPRHYAKPKQSTFRLPPQFKLLEIHTR
jgi:hypothetical protein